MTDPDGRPRLFRSCLYVPGHHTDRFEAAYNSPADAVILDLEDAVPVPLKLRARANVAAVIKQGPPKPTYVRVNSVRSGLCEQDVCAMLGPGLTGIRIAKAHTAAEVRQVDRLLTAVGSDAVLHPLIETAHALEHAFAMATAARRVTMLGLGESDLWADLHVSVDSPTTDAARARVIIASRAAGLPSPAQSVFPQVRDLKRLLTSSQHGRNLGFVGRMAIHPSQIPIIHEVYTPEPAQIAEALEICEAEKLARDQDRTIVITPSGRMVGPPMIAAARNTLELARSLALISEVG
jgi:citrate lyase subunit beta/citryl-CoA lyase